MTDAIRRNLAHLALAAALAGCGGAPEAPPLVAVDTPSIRFTADDGGAAPAVRTITVVNGGGGTLDLPTVAVSYVEGTEGWLSATVAGFEVTLAASTDGLSRGHYAGVVTVASAGSSNGSIAIPVALDVFQPALAVSQMSLTLRATTGVIPTPITFTVANGSDGALAVPTATASTLLTTQVAGDTAPFTVSVTLSSPIVLTGDWSGTITVDAANASNGPLTIPVTIEIRLPPPAADAVTVVCNRPAAYMCVELTSTSEPQRTAFLQDCLVGSGTVVDTCPSENKYVGCLDIGWEETRWANWYYSPRYCPLNLVYCGDGIWTPP